MNGAYNKFVSTAFLCIVGITTTLPGNHDAAAAELITINAEGTDSSNTPPYSSFEAHAISADGSRVVFTSFGSDLGPNDSNGARDYYVRDLSAGTTTLVSINGSGTDSVNSSPFASLFAPTISNDGTKVVLVSSANDFGATDTNGTADVFIRDLVAQTTTMVSVNGSGTDSGNGPSYNNGFISISADGTKVAFRSFANDLGPTDTNGTSDVYVRDLTAGTTTLVSVNGSGTDSGNGSSSNPVLSSDGTLVAFISGANDFGPNDNNGARDVYVRDLVAGVTTLVSANGSATDSGNNFSSHPLISDDGSQVVFISYADDLGPADSNGTGDIYIRNLATETTTLVSVNEPGTDSGNSYSDKPSISADGHRVVFASFGSDLVLGDTNGARDVFVRDLSSGTTALVSVNEAGTDSGNFRSDTPVISADANWVAFESYATDLGPNDSNGNRDVYVRNLAEGTTTLMSANSSRTDSGNFHSDNPVISADGSRVAFMSFADDLGPIDTNGRGDFYAALTTDPVTLVSELIDELIESDLDAGIVNGLYAKLDLVLNFLSNDNDNDHQALYNVLLSFVSSVEAQRGNELTDDEADFLVLAAEDIIDVLET